MGAPLWETQYLPISLNGRGVVGFAPVTITPSFTHIGQEIPFSGHTLLRRYCTRVTRSILALSLHSYGLPVGMHKQGLLIGLQAIGPSLENRTPLTFGALFERTFSGFVPCCLGIRRACGTLHASTLTSVLSPHRCRPDCDRFVIDAAATSAGFRVH